MLPAKRNAYNRNKQQYSKYKMHEGGVQAAGYYPDDVKQQGEATAWRWCCNNFFTEWQQG